MGEVNPPEMIMGYPSIEIVHDTIAGQLDRQIEHIDSLDNRLVIYAASADRKQTSEKATPMLLAQLRIV